MSVSLSRTPSSLGTAFLNSAASESICAIASADAFLRAEGGGLALYGRARVVEVYHVAQVHVRDVKSARVRARIHKAYGLEPVDGLDHRRAGYTQISGNLINIQFEAGGMSKTTISSYSIWVTTSLSLAKGFFSR